MPNYRQDFAHAVRRTRNWNLACPNHVMAEQYVALSPGEDFRPPTEALDGFAADFPFPLDMRAHACVQVHLTALVVFMQRELPVLPVLTFGEVRVDGRPLFGASRQSLWKLVQAGPDAPGDTHLHAWLTWPELTLLDLSILPTLGEVHDASGRQQTSALVGRPEDLRPRFEYVPHAVGTELVWRIGAMFPMVEPHFRQSEAAWLERLGKRLR